MRRRPLDPTGPFDLPASAWGRLALLAGLLCITACESSQLLLIAPTAVSPLAKSGRALLARRDRPVLAANPRDVA